jgi:hypothetical protein
MRNLFWILFILVGCTPESTGGALLFGDKANVVSGRYNKSRALIINQIDDEYMAPCKTHQYYAEISRNGLSVRDYVCHEDLRAVSE